MITYSLNMHSEWCDMQTNHYWLLHLFNILTVLHINWIMSDLTYVKIVYTSSSTFTNNISLQPLPDPPLPSFICFLLDTMSVHCYSQFAGLPTATWEIREGDRGHWYLITQTECLCPGMSRWWIWLALGWHGHIHRKARTPQHCALSLASPLFRESLFLTLSALSAQPQRRVNQHNLSSPLSMQGRQQYGSRWV